MYGSLKAEIYFGLSKVLLASQTNQKKTLKTKMQFLTYLLALAVACLVGTTSASANSQIDFAVVTANELNL